jgi:hypothetical protein
MDHEKEVVLAPLPILEDLEPKFVLQILFLLGSKFV